MIQALIGPIANLAGTWLEGKVETKKAETADELNRRSSDRLRRLFAGQRTVRTPSGEDAGRRYTRIRKRQYRCY